MIDSPENQRTAALAAGEAGRLAEEYQLWLPLADNGDAEAQAHVGALLANSLHRFESFKQLSAGTGPKIDAATALSDQAAGARYLEAASAAGIGPASFNLAGLYVGGYGGRTWAERKAKAAELYALAYAQGFTAFGHLMHGTEAGQPYLNMLENYSATNEVPLPGEQTEPPTTGAAPNPQSR